MNELDLAAALERYPGFSVSSVDGEIVLAGSVRPIADVFVSASVSVIIPPEDSTNIRAFAWWNDGVWIGPRHTYLDGSVCAFEPNDYTWRPSHGITSFLNIVAVWITRQMYLRAYGSWPGLQRVHTPLERIVEQSVDEFCGCGKSLRYQDCCHASDLAIVTAPQIARRRNEILFRAPDMTARRPRK